MIDILAVQCKDIWPVISFIKNGVLPIIQIGIPIMLIVMGSIDLGKAVLSSDDKEIKGATGKLIKRAIAAVAVFFVALLVNLVMGWISDTNSDTESWSSCWNYNPEASSNNNNAANGN